MMSLIKNCLSLKIYTDFICKRIKERSMKKFYVLLAICTLIGACNPHGSLQEPTNKYHTLVLNKSYDDDALRYRENISIKVKGDTFVTYEYKDVRIDELAPLAIKYCENSAQGTDARLREIVLYHNNARRATFDCVNLAM